MSQTGPVMPKKAWWQQVLQAIYLLLSGLKAGGVFSEKNKPSDFRGKR